MRPSTSPWQSFKLIRTTPDPTKANYTLRWNGERLAWSREQHRLAETPGLHSMVLGMIRALDAFDAFDAFDAYEARPVCGDCGIEINADTADGFPQWDGF